MLNPNFDPRWLKEKMRKVANHPGKEFDEARDGSLHDLQFLVISAQTDPGIECLHRALEVFACHLKVPAGFNPRALLRPSLFKQAVFARNALIGLYNIQCNPEGMRNATQMSPLFQRHWSNIRDWLYFFYYRSVTQRGGPPNELDAEERRHPEVNYTFLISSLVCLLSSRAVFQAFLCNERKEDLDELCRVISRMWFNFMKDPSPRPVDHFTMIVGALNMLLIVCNEIGERDSARKLVFEAAGGKPELIRDILKTLMSVSFSIDVLHTGLLPIKIMNLNDARKDHLLAFSMVTLSMLVSDRYAKVPIPFELETLLDSFLSDPNWNLHKVMRDVFAACCKRVRTRAPSPDEQRIISASISMFCVPLRHRGAADEAVQLLNSGLLEWLLNCAPHLHSNFPGDLFIAKKMSELIQNFLSPLLVHWDVLAAARNGVLRLEKSRKNDLQKFYRSQQLGGAWANFVDVIFERQAQKYLYEIQEDVQTKCAYCKKDKLRNPLQKCAKCRAMLYCSKDCQTSHWTEEHKQTCAATKRTAEKELMQKRIDGFETFLPYSDAFRHYPGFRKYLEREDLLVTPNAVGSKPKKPLFPTITIDYTRSPPEIFATASKVEEISGRNSSLAKYLSFIGGVGCQAFEVQSYFVDRDGDARSRCTVLDASLLDGATSLSKTYAWSTKDFTGNPVRRRAVGLVGLVSNSATAPFEHKLDPEALQVRHDRIDAIMMDAYKPFLLAKDGGAKLPKRAVDFASLKELFSSLQEVDKGIRADVVQSPKYREWGTLAGTAAHTVALVSGGLY